MLVPPPRAWCLVLALAGGGCDVLGGGGAFGEACDHLAAAPNLVTAATSAASAPVLTTHTRYDVNLPAVAAGRSGAVKFVAAVRGQVIIVLSEDVPVRVTGSTGSELAPTSSGNSGPCATLKAWYGYEVSAGQNVITLGGPAVSIAQIGLVIESEVDAL
jgi:hypothetical protein